jgi:hypothetical protein
MNTIELTGGATSVQTKIRILAFIGLIIPLCLFALWYKMIQASYADEGHECQSKLWARYVGYFLIFFATLGVLKGIYMKNITHFTDV